MIPALKARADDTEKLRKLHPDTISELRDSGLMRVLQPARYGGGEHDYPLFLEVLYELARGCASTAWCGFNYGSHNWMLGMFPAEAQQAVWSEHPDLLMASSLIYSGGTAEPVDGGYRISGKWPFSSGVDWAEFILVGATVAETATNKGSPWRIAVLPRSEVEVIDTWHVSGLAGTGSNHIAVQDRWVPAYMVIDTDEIRGNATAGSAVNPGALYRLPVLGVFAYLVTAVVLGNAAEAINEYVTSIKSRATTYSQLDASRFTTVHQKIAEAHSLVDAAHALMRQDNEEAMAIAERGMAPSIETKVRWRRNAAYQTQMGVRATDILHAAGGGGANYLTNSMQRRFRDAHAAAAQIQVSWDINSVEYGRVAVGLEPTNPAI